MVIIRTDGTYERKALRISRTSLDQELIPPAVQSVKALGVVHIIDKYAAIGASVKRYPQGLKSLLPGSIP